MFASLALGISTVTVIALAFGTWGGADMPVVVMNIATAVSLLALQVICDGLFATKERP